MWKGDVLLFQNSSPAVSCQSNEAKTKEEHGSGFRGRINSVIPIKFDGMTRENISNCPGNVDGVVMGISRRGAIE
jgi:hypothetical protein